MGFLKTKNRKKSKTNTLATRDRGGKKQKVAKNRWSGGGAGGEIRNLISIGIEFETVVKWYYISEP